MGNIKLKDWWNDFRALRWFLVTFVFAYLVATAAAIVQTYKMNDVNYLSVRITQLQAEQRLNICKAMLPGTREAKGYDKDCTNYTSNN